MAEGYGWAFPVIVDAVTGKIKKAVNEDMVHQSVKMVLGTNFGERYLEPEFGAGLQKYAFEIADYTTLKEIEKDVRESLALWEKRITEVEALARLEDDGRVVVDVSYRIGDIDAVFHYSHHIAVGEEG